LPIFDLLREVGELTHDDCYRTFNMGIGYIIVLPEAHRDRAMNLLRQAGEQPYEIGMITPGEGQVTFVEAG
jgi:phosphoribosylformylglycinamidine cyclo-ligase